MPIARSARASVRATLAAAAGTMLAAAALPCAPASAQMSARQLDLMVPKHPEFLGALAPENLKKERPKAPVDFTGTWFVDLSEGMAKFRFGSDGYPEFLEPGKEAMEGAKAAQARGETYRDAIGQCFPAGMPMVLTRVWPFALVQLPTVMYFISNFNNEFRPIYLDGREFSDPDTVVYSYNGESIGHWEGDTLVVETRYIEPHMHYIDAGIPVTEDFRVVERMKLVEGGKKLEVEYVMTDPNVWVGEWRTTKRYNREDYTDINEVHCLPDMNDHLPGTVNGQTALEARVGGAEN